MTKPTDQQFTTAIMYLEMNEGDEEEGGACRAVAAWLAQLLADEALRKAARDGGVPVAVLRRKLAERAST
jgi:rRNA-processing protein FCF1